MTYQMQGHYDVSDACRDMQSLAREDKCVKIARIRIL